MDKELIAMCDTPEIQGNIFEHGEFTAVVGRDGSFPTGPDKVFIPSVSWLLRKIVKLGASVQLNGANWQAASVGPPERDYFISSFCDSPEKALLHVLMWQKGKTWQNGKWVKRGHNG